jgi:putative nucleotidyltransferase with HDIG domain
MGLLDITAHNRNKALPAVKTMIRRPALLVTLSFKLSLFMVTLVLITTLVFSLITLRTMDRHMVDEVMKRADVLGKSAAELATYSILSRDLLGLDTIVTKIKSANPDIEYVAIVRNSMTVLAHSDIRKRETVFIPVSGNVLKQNAGDTIVSEVTSGSAEYFDIVSPVVFQKKQIGTVFIRMNKASLLEAKGQVRRQILGGLAAVLSFSILGIIAISSLITRPVKELAKGVDVLKEGKKAHPLKIYSRDELGVLTASFNEMTEMISNQRAELGSYAQELQQAYIATVKVLSAAIDARDPYTHGHSTRVAILSLKMGKALGFSKKELEDLEIACLFHDVGKMRTPDNLLFKEGKFSREERQEIMRHTEDGAQLLSRAPFLHKYIPAVRHHHEWFNGDGYPDGLSGDDIPRNAAIMSIADAFDAMTSMRPYRSSLSQEEAIGEIVRCAGTQFDPHLVNIFVRIVKRIKTAGDQAFSRN